MLLIGCRSNIGEISNAVHVGAPEDQDMHKTGDTKILDMHRQFHCMGGRCVTPSWIMNQMAANDAATNAVTVDATSFEHTVPR